MWRQNSGVFSKITASPSVCVPAVLGPLTVWIQNHEKKSCFSCCLFLKTKKQTKLNKQTNKQTKLGPTMIGDRGVQWGYQQAQAAARAWAAGVCSVSTGLGLAGLCLFSFFLWIRRPNPIDGQYAHTTSRVWQRTRVVQSLLV